MSQLSDDRPTIRTELHGLTEDETHELLSSHRRRLVVDLVGRRTTPVELDDLAAGIAARGPGGETSDEETVERVQISLHHVHLPKLDDLGVIRYDADDQRVEPSGPTPDP